jgi:uncharacterized protein YprB with RNaseH-like and TPR domain
MILPPETSPGRATLPEDEYLFAWDPMPGIVSVWAQRDGQAVIWRREQDRILCLKERYYPWLLATSLDDLSHLGPALQPFDASAGPIVVAGQIQTLSHLSPALVRYRKLTGPVPSYSFLLFSHTMRILEQSVIKGASHRLKGSISKLSELGDDYYAVGPVEQYLMSSGKVYFRHLNYEDLHRMQFDLETTALDPHRGRIFLVAVRDNRGLATVLEAPQPEDEARLITDLCRLIRECDPDVIENHNLFGFDLPFLEHRAAVLGMKLEIGRSGGPMVLESHQETFAVGPETRKRTRYTVLGRELIDMLDAVRRHDFVVRDMPSYGLKDVARYFGIAARDRTYIEGAAIFETYRHDPEQVRSSAVVQNHMASVSCAKRCKPRWWGM